MIRLILIVGLACASISGVLAADRPAGPKPEETPELIKQGKDIYFKRCSFCHGLQGDGNGPAADYLDPRPRDFTLGTFKFRTTQSGELPLDEDLFRTISRGLSGTAMQGFDSDLIKNGLSERERWAVIYYLKTFAPEFADPEYDPAANNMIVGLPSQRAPYDAETIAKGKDVFDKAKCWECHGKQGRGDGQKAFDRTDDWGFPIRIRNVTHPWKIKAGTAVEDIYMRFSTGINGTPMPSFIDALTGEERWNLANYIKSLQHQVTKNETLTVQRIDSDIPGNPDHELWQSAAAMDMRLTGQVIGAPRWQTPGIELVTIKALHNDRDIAFLIQWDDPFKDVTHNEALEFDAQDIVKAGAYHSYIQANDVLPRQLETFRDAVALQFPIKPVVGTKKPHFFRGDASNPVHLWIWQADKAFNHQRPAEEAVARGWKQSPKLQGEDQQQISAYSGWEQGRWNVIMKRPLRTDDRNDVQFIKGQFIPVAVNAWDGSNGEHKLIMSISSWYSVILEVPTPASVYIYTALAMGLTGFLGIGLTRKAQAETNID